MQTELSKKIDQAARWSSVTEICAKLIAPVTNAILARLLMPEVFGVVASLTLIVSFAEVFTDAGFQKYLVQHEFTDEEDLNRSTNAAFWTNLLLSLLLWGLIAAFASPIAKLAGAPGYENAIIVMSAQIPLQAFSGIQLARYRREFAFQKLFAARMAVSLVPLVVTVPVALILRDHWALVVGTLARDAVNAVVLTAKSPWRPSFRYDIGELKKMLPFSLWTMLENITIWLSANAGILILSGVLSPYYLGLFKTTVTTGNAYMGIITAAAAPVLFSALSRSQKDAQQFREIFFRFQRMTALLVFPLAFGVFAYRDLATRILLGSQWLETADFLGLWFLASGLTVVLHNYNSEAFRSMGKPKLSILVQVLYMAVLIPVLLWAAGQPYGVLTAARAAVMLTIIAISSAVLQRAVGIRFADALKNIWPPLVSAVLMALVGMGLQTVLQNAVWQFVSILLCAAVYIGFLLLIPAGRRQLAQLPALHRLIRQSRKGA